MAILKTDSGETFTNLEDIKKVMADIGVELSHWPLGDNMGALLEKPALNDNEKEEVLKGLDHYFHQLEKEENYKSRDLIVLHDAVPGLDDLLKKFIDCHTHDDDEVRYIVDGSGVFGFVFPDGRQVSLQVSSEDYIRVPKNTEHWFLLDENKCIKAVRYFSGTDGWTPKYTGTERKL